MPHILMVDDERQIRTLLSLTLRRAGHQVTAAADETALRFARGQTAVDLYEA
jgi:CheY-like chemotaxis protein